MPVYEPVQDGVPRGFPSVRYSEVAPPSDLSELVHCFWELKTSEELAEDFRYHALPDACVNLLFNQVDRRVAGLTAIHTTAVVLNLGSSFHYVGIQLFPGVWRGSQEELANSYVGAAYEGSLPLLATNERIADLGLEQQARVLAELVRWCRKHGVVAPNAVTRRIASRLGEIRSVADMAAATGLSTRQLQRVLKSTTGFSPHDLLKVLRLQRSFRAGYLDHYADQSHFIHAFRSATGYTPTRYRAAFRDQIDAIPTRPTADPHSAAPAALARTPVRG